MATMARAEFRSAAPAPGARRIAAQKPRGVLGARQGRSERRPIAERAACEGELAARAASPLEIPCAGSRTGFEQHRDELRGLGEVEEELIEGRLVEHRLLQGRQRDLVVPHAITYPRLLLRVIGQSFEGSWRWAAGLTRRRSAMRPGWTA
ncbi:hypothetical protein [Sorangium sp. So ce124]|uniref:hypothetical protein n=1 Tax=Sorangium sp. So ce124 TaxID=3133280 RepID=UPI003F63EBA7